MKVNEKDTIDVLLVEPGQYPRPVTIGTDLESLQETVGGYIEAVYPFENPVAIVCDEEGKIDGAPLNRALRNEDGDIVDIIAGPFFICGIDEDSFTDLPADLADKYDKMFHRPEAFLKLGSRMLAIPMDPVKPAPAVGPDRGQER